MPEIVPDRIAVPMEIRPLIDAIRARMRPSAVWLFGSRARGDARTDSDWDLLVSLPDEASADLLDPLVAWDIRSGVGINATILTALSRDLAEIWGVPNTLGFDLAREGRRLDV